MAVEVILPRVDMDMETGKINRWFVAEGETVAKGKPLFEIETDKAAMEIEAPADGVLRVAFGLEDRIIPPAQARGLPGAVALHLMPGVGHMPHFEARAETAHIVEDNLAAGDRRDGPC